jgi:hypothetical protein
VAARRVSRVDPTDNLFERSQPVGNPVAGMTHDSSSMDSASETAQIRSTAGSVVVWRWRWVIASGTLCCMVAAGLVTFAVPRSYRVRTVIETGDLGDEYAKDVERLVRRVNAFDERSGGQPVAADRPLIQQFAASRPLAGSQASPEPRMPLVLEMSLTTQLPDQVVPEFRRSAERLVADLTAMMSIQEARYAAIARRADDLRASLVLMRAARDEALRRSDRLAGALVFGRLTEDIAASESRLAELDRLVRLQELRQNPPRYVVPIEISKLSVRRRLFVDVVVGFLVGLAASVALAFTLQWTLNTRRGSD